MNQPIPGTEKNPNPQGKGCVAVMQDWASLRPQLPQQKSAAGILRDYCLSALVLAAKFRFCPVRNKTYYLYCGEDDWSLSLIAPGEWGSRMPGDFVADCRLQDDMTWHLEFPTLHEGTLVTERLQRFVENFTRTISNQTSPSDELPFYVDKLPYFQRMLASGLAASLQHSIGKTGKEEVQRFIRAEGSSAQLTSLSPS